MVLGTTHKRHMIPAPPPVSSVPNTDAPQSRHHILRKQHDAPLSSTALSPAVLSATLVPPGVPPLYQKYGVIHRNSFKPLGRPCIPFHSIPQTANAGVCRLPGVQWNGKEGSIHCAALMCPCLCCHIPFSFSSFHRSPLPYSPPPPLPLIQCGTLIVGANPIAFKGSGRNFSL
ncbi:hypothetical protein XELAEV_18029040mg [Xenopus laevis]|uniref:Uncharacterized protein n=1 Tax=Xenopus laevis TaxID=8355 RepID=A0A974HHE5_XENLA|nr:hypothetical protein XELAEV_18029040mg [Xenopus laevis]